jgi:hypothetical protein
VDCRESELRFVSLSIDLKETVLPNGQLKYDIVADPNMLRPSDVVTNVTYGAAVLKARMSVHGASTGLSKNVTLQFQLLSLVRDAGYIYYSSRSIIVKPTISSGCITYDGSDSPTCTIAGKPEIKVTRSTLPGLRDAGPVRREVGWSSGLRLNMALNWKKAADQLFDTETFKFALDRIEYRFEGGSYELARSGTPLLTNFFSAALGEIPKLRCDRGLADDGGASVGCVFLEAAPVIDLRKYPKAADVVLHVKDAQDGASQSIRPVKSPGLFKYQPGSIAVADSSVVGDQALQMMREQARRDLNRDVSCSKTISSSLLNNRPYYGSASCSETNPGSGVPPASCNCDEYPMASTWQGAGVSAGNQSKVSVKYVLGRDNSSSGGALGNFYKQFYKRERVLDLTDYGAVSLRPTGDNFWVNARDRAAPTGR